MDLLLDTHILIWFLTGNERLTASTKSAIKNLNNNCYISIASIWEMALKTRIGKLELSFSFEDLKNLIIQNQIDILPIDFEHIQLLTTLPLHHSDPFDRMIIAQAITEDFILISNDKLFEKYNEIRLFN